MPSERLSVTREKGEHEVLRTIAPNEFDAMNSSAKPGWAGSDLPDAWFAVEQFAIDGKQPLAQHMKGAAG
jgi:hypothetical protein